MLKTMNWVRVLVLTLAAAMLAACNTMPKRDDPGYAATPPMPQPVPQAGNGAIYQAGHDIVLFQDIKARRIGDTLTIVLTESTNASKTASTSVSKSTDVGITNPTLFGRPVTKGGTEILGMDLGSESDFSGEGDSSQSNSLSGNVTVTVANVLPNGNLLVRGEKRLTLNQGEEFVQISGIVRPVDIRADNTVLSTQIADARITYAGKGAVADSNAMGWLARFFVSAIWPF